MLSVRANRVRRARRKAGYVAVLAAAGLAMAACSSSGGGTAQASGSASGSAASADGGSPAVASALAKYQAQPTFTAPGPAFDAKAAAGKTVWVVPTSSAVPLVIQDETAIKQALGTVGVKSQAVTTSGLVTEWVNGIDQAVSQKADGIILIGVDPNLVRPQLAAAAAAHIPVVYTFSITGQPVAPYVTGNAAIDYPEAGDVMVLKAIADTDGNAHIALIESKELASHQSMIPAIKAELKATCPACTIETTIDVPIADWSTQITSDVTTARNSNPKINIVMPLSDTMAEYVIPALRSASSSQVKIETEGASAAIVAQVPDDISSDIGWSNPWVGYASADQVLRGMTGTAAVKSENIPIVLFDSANATKVGKQDPSVYFGTAFINGYRKLWGAA
jgi:ribose transport system substrate-binding protein